MPIYEYTCEHCKYNFDRLVTIGNAKVNCPLCQGKVKKLMSAFSVGAPHGHTGGLPVGAHVAQAHREERDPRTGGSFEVSDPVGRLRTHEICS